MTARAIRQPSTAVALLAFALGGCPARVQRDEIDPAGPVTKSDDPRVVRDGADLYVADAASAPVASAATPNSRGTGQPDESNGVCRLYAPELQNPICCAEEYGFDADSVRRVCGHQAYLGEHFRASCGYYFASEGRPYTWFRASFIPQAKTTKEAADSHDRTFQRRGKRPDFRSDPIPGLPGAYWSRDAELRWAFLPGWSKVRRVTWRDDACPEEKIVEVLAGISAAKEPPAGAERPGLVPVARP